MTGEEQYMQYVASSSLTAIIGASTIERRMEIVSVMCEDPDLAYVLIMVLAEMERPILPDTDESPLPTRKKIIKH